MAAKPPNVEQETAEFLCKLIKESKVEPTELAKKLYVDMRSFGKENSIPYQVISREMETVINQHGLDIEALMSSLASGTHLGDSSASQASSEITSNVSGSSERAAVEKDSEESVSSVETS